jgi:hypothetical protein
MQSLAFTNEERDTEVVFKLANACGYIRLDTVQPLGGTRNSTFPNDG